MNFDLFLDYNVLFEHAWCRYKLGQHNYVEVLVSEYG